MRKINLLYFKKTIAVLLLVFTLSHYCLAENENTSSTELPFQVTDLADRKIIFNKTPRRIILGESRYLFALSILDTADPFERVVGMLADLKQVDYGSYLQYQKKFPKIDHIPKIGHTSADSLSLEKILSLNADLAIFGVDGHGPNAKNKQVIDQLQKAGVNIIFIDFRNDPLVNTVKSIQLLGKVLSRTERAEEFIEFYHSELNKVSSILSEFDSSQPRPSTFLHSRVGLQDLCCETMVKGMMASFLNEARGNNVAVDLVPGYAGVLNLEYLLTHQPDIYIATAIGSINERQYNDELPYIILGAGVDEESAQHSFRHALNNNRIGSLSAIKSNKAYAIWHHFYNTPLNVIAVQVFAKWLYPDAFSHLMPKDNLQILFDRFQSVPLNGTYWLSLDNHGPLS